MSRVVGAYCIGLYSVGLALWFMCVVQVCGLQLTLKTFSRASTEGSDKEVFCRTHVPKISATSVGGDAVGIRTALDAQKQASGKVVHLSDRFVGPI